MLTDDPSAPRWIVQVKPPAGRLMIVPGLRLFFFGSTTAIELEKLFAVTAEIFRWIDRAPPSVAMSGLSLRNLITTMQPAQGAHPLTVQWMSESPFAFLEFMLPKAVSAFRRAILIAVLRTNERFCHLGVLGDEVYQEMRNLDFRSTLASAYLAERVAGMPIEGQRLYF